MKYDLEYTVKHTDDGMTARGVLRKRLGVSQRLIRKISNASVLNDGFFVGGVYLNNRTALFIDRVKEGDRIGLVYPDEVSGFVPQDISVDVLYEDDDIIAVNKQPGVVVHPTKGHVDGTIANGLMKRMLDRGERYKIRFANRLDMDTSGILLIGKNAHAQSEFARQSEAGRIRKLYFAALDGIPSRNHGHINEPIALEREGSPRRTVREGGAPSRSFYRVLERYGNSAHSQYYKKITMPKKDEKNVYDASEMGIDNCMLQASLVLVSITTGRTHQIRVHMAHLGCPVLGDALYGRQAPEHIIGRQALHAAFLRFMHPKTREEITLEAPLPSDMVDCLRTLAAPDAGMH
ncbi:MAG: RluA family pseudouridine synthase [Clostridiales Family XIII bacterium]|jgi:23S rRNA pseudouridine1911/1915/1917 synthase|nr:RluA family pseudouridine synthase [Clostridiales Family XIII bacterium]